MSGVQGNHAPTRPSPELGPLRPLGVKGPRGHRVLREGQSPVLDIMGAPVPALTQAPAPLPRVLRG